MSSLVCVGCGCSETKACVVDGKPCGWASLIPPVCTACRDKIEAAGNLHSGAELEADLKRLAGVLDDELAEGVGFLVFCFTPQQPTKLVALSNAKIEDQVAATHAWLALADRNGAAVRASDPIQVTRLRNYLLEYQTPDRAIGQGVGDVVDAAIVRFVEITNQYLDLKAMHEELLAKTRIVPAGEDSERRTAGGIIIP